MFDSFQRPAHLNRGGTFPQAPVAVKVASMKTLLPILLLFATACGSKDGENEEFAQTAAELPNAAAPVLPAGEDPALLRARVVRAMAVALPGAADAQYRALRPGVGGSACGEVATAGKSPLAGIFRPFVVTPDGLAVVAEAAVIDWEDPDDFMADAWIRWCATPEELQRLGPRLQSAAANSAAAATPVPEGPDLPLPPVLAETPAAPPEPAAAPPPRPRKSDAPPPRIDSFFNSVDRAE